MFFLRNVFLFTLPSFNRKKYVLSFLHWISCSRTLPLTHGERQTYRPVRHGDWLPESWEATYDTQASDSFYSDRGVTLQSLEITKFVAWHGSLVGWCVDISWLILDKGVGNGAGLKLSKRCLEVFGINWLIVFFFGEEMEGEADREYHYVPLHMFVKFATMDLLEVYFGKEIYITFWCLEFELRTTLFGFGHFTSTTFCDP